MPDFPARLKRLRKERKMTQEDLARVLDCSRTTIAYYEADKRSPTPETLCLIADYFNVSLDYLYGRTYNPISPDFRSTGPLNIMLLYDPVTGQIIDCSQAAQVFYGYKKEELLKMTVFDLNIDTTREINSYIEKIITGRQNVFNLKHRIADGTVKELEINAEPVLINNKTYFYAIYRDVTESKARENKLITVIIAMIRLVARMIKIRCPYKEHHAERVTRIASLIGEKMGLLENQMISLQAAGMLHDFGEIFIPGEILNKQDRLSSCEYELIKNHPEAGFNTVKNLDMEQAIEQELPIAEIILQHHERLDGSGYPRGLKRSRIRPEARILAAADVFESMTARRPYRDAFSPEEVLSHLHKYRGIKFDPDVIDTLALLFQQGSLDV